MSDFTTSRPSLPRWLRTKLRRGSSTAATTKVPLLNLDSVRPPLTPAPFTNHCSSSTSPVSARIGSYACASSSTDASVADETQAASTAASTTRSAANQSSCSSFSRSSGDVLKDTLEAVRAAEPWKFDLQKLMLDKAREDQAHKLRLAEFHEQQRLRPCAECIALMDRLWSGEPCRLPTLVEPQRRERTLHDVLRDSPRAVPI